MNFLSEIYWTIKWKIEDAFYAVKDKFNNDSYEIEHIEEIEEKPKKKKSKKKSAKKSV